MKQTTCPDHLEPGLPSPSILDHFHLDSPGFRRRMLQKTQYSNRRKHLAAHASTIDTAWNDIHFGTTSIIPDGRNSSSHHQPSSYYFIYPSWFLFILSPPVQITTISALVIANPAVSVAICCSAAAPLPSASYSSAPVVLL